MIFKDISKRIPLLIVADLLCFIGAVIVGSAIVAGESAWRLSFDSFLTAALLIFPVIFYIFDLYFPYKLFKFGLTLFEVTLCVALGGLILAALSYLNRDFSWGRRPFILTLALFSFFVMGVRMGYDFVFQKRFLAKPTVILGTGDLAKSVLHALDHTVHSGLNILGVIAEGDDAIEDGEKWKRLSVLGNVRKAKEVMAKHGAQLAILAFDERAMKSDAAWLGEVSTSGVQITSGVYLLERLTGTIPDELMDSHTILSLVAQVRGRPYLKLKRILDVFSALILLLLSAPVWIITITGLAFEGMGRVFFVQDRLGLNGKPFKLYKFRSMTADRGGKPVVTILGKWLRKYRIDELPQLINVLKGDMSLVGPRPEIEYFVKRSIAKIPMYEAVFAVKPGLTGWAQVKFRYTTSVKDYHEKFRFNLYYLKHVSFVLDLLIIFKTIRIVMLGLGQ